MDASPPPNRPRKPRRRWRWHVPPALTHGGESLEGAPVLDEVQGPLGLLLWETYRDVVLWAGAEEREGLFHDDAHARRVRDLDAVQADPELDAALRAAAAVVADPAGAQETAVMDACRQAALWAEKSRLMGTAVTLATAGALAAPANAAAAVRVGQLARSKGEHARAETWYRRAIGLGRQAKDWASYAQAFIGLGSLYQLRGNYPGARRFYIRALRAARRHALRDLHARALHDLFTIAVQTGPPAEAQDLARQAFRVYGPRHPRLPALAHDVAYFWMEQGRFAPALDVFRAVLPHLADPGERLVCAGNLGRAAAAVGQRPLFEEAWEQVWIPESWPGMAQSGEALLELAQGASTLRDWSRAEKAAETGRDLAQQRGQGHLVIRGDTLLEAARRKRGMELPTPAADATEDTRDLAADLVRSLRTSGAR